MSKSLTLILGGARSGKSTYALQQAHQIPSTADPTAGHYHVMFVATALAFDDEMRARIDAHKAERPPDWYTLEAPTQVGEAMLACPVTADVVILDCLTLLANNVILALPDPENVDPDLAQATLDGEIEGILAAYAHSEAHWLIVSNEVGLGLVPPYPLGRIYRDVLGRANQRLAQAADHVLFMVAGLPLTVK